MPGMYFWGWDPTYILVLIGAIISMIASANVKSTYNKYSRVRSMTGLTGAEAAQRILNSQGIYDVRIEHVSGQLTDHYDPRAHVLRLSDSRAGKHPPSCASCPPAAAHGWQGCHLRSAPEWNLWK